MDVVTHFEKRKAETEASLRYAETTPGFRLREVTTQGERDITDEHKSMLRGVIKEYQKALDYLHGKS